MHQYNNVLRIASPGLDRKAGIIDHYRQDHEKKGWKAMPKGAQIALRALAEAIDEVGNLMPASNHIPARTKTVTFEQWRNYSYRRGISASNEPRAKQQAFKRASEYLIGEENVGAWDNQVWPAKEQARANV